MSIHQRIRERRQQLGIASLEKLAERIFTVTGKRFAWQTVQLWEKEDGTAPSRKNAPYVAQALGCSVEWLTTGVGTPEDSVDLPAPPVTPENPGAARMTLQYVTPEESELLEWYRLSYEDGRLEIKLTAQSTKKRPLSLAGRSDETQV